MKTLSITLALLCAATAAQAQTGAPAQSGGNSGQQIATSGAPNGVTACASCHGAKGEGNAAANFPRIAGQPKLYLASQLKNYANGSRDNPIMSPIAKALTPEQIDAVTAYYAGVDAPSAKSPAPDGQAGKRGQQLANVGDDKIGVQACVNCHGPGGAGEPPSFPYLAGQHANYLKASLAAWKSGARKTDPSMQMTMIAKRLSDADISALAAYFSSQPSPAPEPQRVNIAAQPGPSAGPSQAGGASAPATGTGSEQGAPTTGGSQGIGGGGGTSTESTGNPSGGTR